ncbi:MAG TPA: flagellar basal body rod protein FlgC [Fimbriimonadaceae bacterium]|nr:flagellar basal body rod protein FlgC [Fimbriimonadaceae bacterium]
MNLNSALRISASGLAAERFRMDTISANIANANTIRKPGADAWHRKDVIFSGDANGVRVVGMAEDKTAYTIKYEPENPYADENGQVFYSNVDPLQEMVNMMSASRAYEANIEAFNSAKSMIRSALEIGKI